MSKSDSAITAENPKSCPRKGRDGRTINTARIGKNKRAKTPRPRSAAEYYVAKKEGLKVRHPGSMVKLELPNNHEPIVHYDLLRYFTFEYLQRSSSEIVRLNQNLNKGIEANDHHQSPSSHEPYNQVLEITPAKATYWLDANEGNRRLDWNYIAQLARDIKAGQFACTHQGIAFDTQGRLIDGQHRLWAIIEADVPVKIRVFYNESPESTIHIDGNHPRRAADRMTLGRSLGTVRAEELATLRAMLGGITMSTKRRTVYEEMPLLEGHRAAIHLAIEHLPTTRPAGLANCMSRAVVARALYCVGDEGILARFCDVLRRGASTGSLEHIVVTLRNHLIELRKYGMNQTVRQRQYALVTRHSMPISNVSR